MHINFWTRSLTCRLLSLALVMLGMSAGALAQFRVAITIAPPALPVYEQPVCPGDGYIWTPGYWYWDDDAADYYWVPGTWVEAPEVGFLWTPGYWGWGGNAFLFHEGYWGPEVGFYGGINYGFGYFGVGFAGGRWDNGHFFYNRAVSNVNVTNIRNVYNTTVVNTTVNRVSYNGGNGGIEARATAQQEAAARGRHIPPVAAQTQHVQAARSNQQLRASVNHGKPPIAATDKPGEFKGRSVIAAKEAGAPYHPPTPNPAANRGAAEPKANEQPNRAEENRPAENRATEENSRPATAVHPKDLPPIEHSAAPNSGDAKVNQKYQKQQQKLDAQQEKERQQLQQKQDQEHQQASKQKADAAKTQQLEAKHQQQTQQLQQKHAAQQQQMQQRQQASRPSAPPPHKG